jgi:hypothetical protein
MIEHIVLLKWKKEASPEAINTAMTGLRSLKGKVPEVVDLTCGENFSERNKSYTHGLVVRFKDKAALNTYIAHPEHQHVVQTFINPIREDTIAVDYEF